MNTWQKKLLAFLHDPPHKALNIAKHEDTRRGFLAQAGFTEPEVIVAFDKVCDWTAAAADRFPFPSPQASGLHSDFKGTSATPFRHPLGGSDYIFERPLNDALAEECFQKTQGGIHVDELPEADRDWARFFLHWRRWPAEAAQHKHDSYFLPADTRLPDHNIWIHNSVTSALQSCVTENDHLCPAFLIFQFRPVQEFIAQARSTRDLWSGSYLLAWLIAHAIKAVTDEVGPDSVIFPALRGQPIFDLLHRDRLYSKVTYADGPDKQRTLWQRMKEHEKEMLTPNLPNRFFAVVPAARAEDLANTAEKAVCAELGRIAEACRQWFAEQGHPFKDDWQDRFKRQVELFPQIHWQVIPWTGDVKSALTAYETLDAAAGKCLRDLDTLATQTIPEEHRDTRYFIGKDDKKQLNNRGFCWAYFYALTDRLLAARRNTRDFKQWLTDDHQSGARKDSFSGKEEVVGDEDWWEGMADHEVLTNLFRSSDRLGAMNLIKKVWHKAYLEQSPWGLDVGKVVSFKSVPDVAEAAWEGVNNPKSKDKPPNYYAVIALDGDEMGKWVSGEKAPKFVEQLSTGAKKYFEELNKRLEENKQEKQDLSLLRRPLSPSYHLQFSEALSNFGLYLSRPVVEHFGGQLIYSGGDDVLAMVPANQAFDCAEALRAAFRGQRRLSELVQGLFEVSGSNGGFVRLLYPKAEQPSWPLIVPGPRADCSVGIAIGHIKSPLQNMVRAAQAAEKIAKNQYHRSAFAVSLYKRSGEILEWGSKWLDGETLELFRQFSDLSKTKSSEGEPSVVSGRFGHALSQRLTVYQTAGDHRPHDAPERSPFRSLSDFPWARVTEAEFRHVLKQQAPANRLKDNERLLDQRNKFEKLALKYIAEYVHDACGMVDFEMLFKVADFINRGER